MDGALASWGLSYTARTNAEGLFRFPDLPISAYEVTVAHGGFDRLLEEGLQLLTGRTVDLRLQLQVGQTTQALEVASLAPLVQTTCSEVQTSFDSRNTRELPLNGRNPLQFVALTPGARLSTVGTLRDQEENPGVTTNGLRTIDNNFQMDGAGARLGGAVIRRLHRELFERIRTRQQRRRVPLPVQVGGSTRHALRHKPRTSMVPPTSLCAMTTSMPVTSSRPA